MSFEIKNGVLVNYLPENGETAVVIPEGVTSITEGAFSYSFALESVTIPNSVKIIKDEAFFHCENLKSVIIGNNVKIIKDCAFYKCSSLELIAIPNSVLSIGEQAFSNCQSIKSITIGNSVKNIGECAFISCYKLESIMIPDSVTSIGKDAFVSCHSLESIKVAENNQNYADLDGVLYNKKLETLIKCPETKTNLMIPDNVKSIEEGALYNCKNLKSITIPDSVTIIEEWCFQGCSSLESITISASIIRNNAFSGCSNLESITCENIKVPFKPSHFDINIDVRNVIKMIKEKDFSAKIPAETKYGMACSIFNQNPAAPETYAYFKKNVLKVLRFAIDEFDTETVNNVIKEGTLITNKNIDKLIDYADEKNRTAIKTILEDYKKQL